jgi:hypothetical protein
MSNRILFIRPRARARWASGLPNSSDHLLDVLGSRGHFVRPLALIIFSAGIYGISGGVLWPLVSVSSEGRFSVLVFACPSAGLSFMVCSLQIGGICVPILNYAVSAHGSGTIG